jgi:hypothetical protein
VSFVSDHSQPQISKVFSNPPWKIYFIFFFSQKILKLTCQAVVFLFFIYYFSFSFLIYNLSSVFFSFSSLLCSNLLPLPHFSLSLKILHLGHFHFLGKSHFSEKVHFFTCKLILPHSVDSAEKTRYNYFSFLFQKHFLFGFSS